MVKKFADMFSGFDTVHQFDRQTDRTAVAFATLACNVSCSRNITVQTPVTHNINIFSNLRFWKMTGICHNVNI